MRILCCEEMKVPGQKANNKVKEKCKGIDKGEKKSIFFLKKDLSRVEKQMARETVEESSLDRSPG